MKWLGVRVGGQRWRVDLVKGNHPKLQQDGRKCHGVTLYDECRIYQAREQSTQARNDTLLHELLHAAFYVSRAHHKLHEVCGDFKLAEDTEEGIVEGLVLVLHPLLEDLGFRFPKGPNDS